MPHPDAVPAIRRTPEDRIPPARGKTARNGHTPRKSPAIARALHPPPAHDDDETDDLTASDEAQAQLALEITRHLILFIRQHVIRSNCGHRILLTAVARRLLILDMLLHPGDHGSLWAEARKLGVTRACTSKIAKELRAASRILIPAKSADPFTLRHYDKRREIRDSDQ